MAAFCCHVVKIVVKVQVIVPMTNQPRRRYSAVTVTNAARDLDDQDRETAIGGTEFRLHVVALIHDRGGRRQRQQHPPVVGQREHNRQRGRHHRYERQAA